MPFQIHALPADPFRALFALDDAALHARDARRELVREHPGTPCRVSLEDARVGETVLLVNHCHLPVQSPYRSSHAIYVREGVAQARPGVGEVPAAISTRLISVRLLDTGDMMVGADVVDGAALDGVLSEALRDPAVRYVHLHYARPGCFAAAVTRPG
ncbi:MAG: DUF1203 domain-containing protein [Maritimibacter sp.]|nr:DUF1203 domain-containing protein [Myxococcales bacterium]MCB1356612.1 DUF1203 domain-containing protein [Maritimibacter sp.]